MKYDMKYDERTQETIFCCAECLATDMIEAIEFTRDFECVELYAHADLITELVRVLLNIEVDGERFSFGMFDIDGNGDDYFGEYVLSINDDYTIWCEPAFRNGELFNSEAMITYVHGDCNSAIQKKLEKDNARVMIFDMEEDFE